MFHQKKLFQKQTLRTAAALLPIGLFMTTSPRDYFITNNAANPTPNNNALSSTSSSSNSSTGSNNSTNTPLKPNPLLHESTTTISTTISVEKEVSTRPLSPIRNLVNLAHCDAQSVATPKIYSYTYPANSPTEDRHIYGSGQNWSYAGVFDGHGGWQIAEMASKQLIHQVLSRLEAKVGTLKDEVSIEKAISESFNEMEKKIVETIRPSFQLGFGEVAKVGSCVLLALRNENHLVVANCGDCRAILGSGTDANSKHYSTRINHDHNCREPLEQILLQEKHPNEPNLVVCKNSHACYVKGRLQLTRSLGDAYLKYAEFNGSPSMGRTAGRYIPEPYTPPYVSHQPEFHHIKLTKEDRFLILGTDGLWDYLPDAEAVEIVAAGIRNGDNESVVAERLVTRALEIAAQESGMNLTQLKNLQPGRSRRGHHDDTTAVVMYF